MCPMNANGVSEDLNGRLVLLDRIYNLYGEFINAYDLACHPGCAACCTCNMTLTTLEGFHLITNMNPSAQKALVEKARDVSKNQRFQPQVTINQIARLCRDGQPVPDETIDPTWGACPLLFEDACPIYELRPFGCRCMVSNVDCRQTGHAEVDDLILTVNNLFLQYIEHIDAQGGTGSLIDILLYLDQPDRLATYKNKLAVIENAGLAPNRPIPVLMVPPEHLHQVQPILQKFQQLDQP